MSEEPVELTPIFEAVAAAVQRHGCSVDQAVGSIDLDGARGDVRIWLRRGGAGLAEDVERSVRNVRGVRSVSVRSGEGERSRSPEVLR